MSRHKHFWLFENLGGMTLFRMVGRRKVYRVRCRECGHCDEITIGAAR